MRTRLLALGRLAGLGLLMSTAIAPSARAVEVVTDVPQATCEEYRLNQELRIYKDPTLFLSSLNLIYQDPAVGWKELMQENPLLTTVKGTVLMMRLGEPREFKNFGAIARLYEVAEPRLRRTPVPTPRRPGERFRAGEEAKRVESVPRPARAALIVPIMLCGETDAYRNTLGFVLQDDLAAAQASPIDTLGGMPPSIHPNPVPAWRKAQTGPASGTAPKNGPAQR